MAMVTANCEKSRPVIPGMKTLGRKTAESTRAMAMTGPETSSMAFFVASLGGRPFSMWCSTASTTTMASSTTRADGQHQTHEGNGVDGESEQGEESKRGDQGNGHGKGRDERGPESLEEDEDDDDHQDHRLVEGLQDLFDPLADGEGGVEGNLIVQVGREGELGLFHQFLHAVNGLDRVRPRELVEREDGRRLPVQAARHGVRLGAQLNPAHILEPDSRPVRVGPEDDIFELLLRLQPALGLDRVGEFLAGRRGFAADLARRVHRVLLPNGVYDLRDGDVELGQLVRPDPDPDGVLAGAEDGDAGNPRNAGELVVQVDIGIVGQEGGIRRCPWGKRGSRASGARTSIS